jgi:hypothetical protein
MVDSGQDAVSQYEIGSDGGLTPLAPQIIASDNAGH